MSVVSELAKLLADQAAMKADLERLKSDALAILTALDRIEKAIGVVVDLGILFKPKGERMANKKATGPEVKCPCLTKKGGKHGLVMPEVTLTDPLPKSITLQPLDASGNAVPLTPADNVTGTLVSDNAAALEISSDPGADSLHYVGTIPANTPAGSVANLAATLKGTIQGAPADLSASVKVTISLPPSPVAVDLAIIFA